MLRTKRHELFWLGLIALCIGLFVAHRMKEQAGGYDQQSMDALVKQSWQPTTKEPDADLVAGSIAAPQQITGSHRYYVSFGNFDSIEMATKRYLDVLSRQPQLKSDENISIETWEASDGRTASRSHGGIHQRLGCPLDLPQGGFCQHRLQGVDDPLMAAVSR